MVEETRRMFRWWHTLRAGGLTRSGFQERMRPLEARVEALLEEGAACDHKKTAGKCRKMLTLRAALWTFVEVEGVEPTLRQRGGAGIADGGDLAEAELRVGERAGEPVPGRVSARRWSGAKRRGGADAHCRDDVPAAGAERP